MKIVVITLMMVAMMPISLLADEVVRATSDMITDFDQTLAASRRQNTVKTTDGSGTNSKSKARPNNFGSVVTEEGRTLKDADKGTREGFGKWVSSQRRQDGDHRPNSNNSGSGSGSSSSDGSDPRGQVPPPSQVPSSSSGRPTSPGHHD